MVLKSVGAFKVKRIGCKGKLIFGSVTAEDVVDIIKSQLQRRIGLAMNGEFLGKMVVLFLSLNIHPFISYFNKHILGTYVAFDALRLGYYPQHVIGRILILWEVHSEIRTVQDRRHFLGISLLLLDEKSTVIHCFIPASRAKGNYAILKEGIILLIGGFEVATSIQHHKMTDHPFVIKFNSGTLLVEDTTSYLKIEKDKFKVYNHAHLLGVANANLALPDVVGLILSIEGSNLKDPNSQNSLIVKLWLQPTVIVTVTIWASTASRLRTMLCHPISVASAVLITAVNPTILEGSLFLDSTIYTRFLFDKNIVPIAKFCKQFEVGLLPKISLFDIPIPALKKEVTCIANLCAFTKKRIQQDAYFLCEATVVDVLSSYGWNNMKCTSCFGTLEPHQNTLLCTNQFMASRFYIALAVLDGSDIATFIVSNHSLNHLICPYKYAKMRTKVQNKSTVTMFPDLSPYLEDLNGNHFIFELKISSYNYADINPNFTVNRIFTTHDHAKVSTAIPDSFYTYQNDQQASSDININNNKGALGEINSKAGSGQYSNSRTPSEESSQSFNIYPKF